MCSDKLKMRSDKTLFMPGAQPRLKSWGDEWPKVTSRAAKGRERHGVWGKGIPILTEVGFGEGDVPSPLGGKVWGGAVFLL